MITDLNNNQLDRNIPKGRGMVKWCFLSTS
ncbi:YolD-like family protein, partial [Staphylococcus warneri]